MSKTETSPKFSDKKYTDIDVSVNDLTIDPEVQRFHFNPRKVEAIVKDFKLDTLGRLTASKRNAATTIVVDGWHRWEAVRRLTDSTGTVPVRVFEGLTRAEEAQMFLDLNPGNQPTALDRYRMRLVIGDSVITAVDKAVHEYGWSVHPIPGTSHLQCVKALERIQNTANKSEAYEGLLEETMRVVSRIFGHERAAGTAVLLEGFAAFLAEFRANTRFEADRLISQIKDFPGGVHGLLGDASTIARMNRMRPPMAIASLLVSQYNKNLRPGGPKELPTWRRTR